VSYRDGIAVVREMLTGKRADALARARSFGYAQRAVVDEQAIAAVEALHDRTMPFLFGDLFDVDEAKTAVAKVEELVAAYDAVLARSASALVPSQLDVEAALTPPEDWRGTATGAERLAGEMQIARDAVERFEVRDRAVAVAAGPWALIVGLDETHSETLVEGRMSVAIPVAVPAVRMRPERAGETMLEDLGLKKEIETGHFSFDTHYWVDGHREAALAAATPLVRRVLLDSYEHAGRLDLGAGVARLSWRGPWLALGPSGIPTNLVPAILELRGAFCE
jgi:hypothetical protein